MAIKAHLNGGPMDDQIVVALGTLYAVGKIDPRPNDIAALPYEVTVRRQIVGTYRARLDSYNQLVPHNLDGAAEYDWAGWDDERS